MTSALTADFTVLNSAATYQDNIADELEAAIGRYVITNQDLVSGFNGDAYQASLQSTTAIAGTVRQIIAQLREAARLIRQSAQQYRQTEDENRAAATIA